MRPLPPGAGTEGYFVLLTFDARTSSLVRRKLELDGFEGQVGAAMGHVDQA